MRTHIAQRGASNGLVAAVSAVAVAAAAVVAVVLVVARGHTSAVAGPSPTASPTSRPVPNCAAAGCALVSLSGAQPPNTVFYGASCTGIDGSWFLNVVEAGASSTLRPSYHLRWTLAPGATTAVPEGVVTIAATPTTTASLTLAQGRLHLTGTQKPDIQADATGTLSVSINRSASSPTLTLTEAGLTRAEQALGLVSPFNVNGKPLTLPVQTVKSLRGC